MIDSYRVRWELKSIFFSSPMFISTPCNKQLLILRRINFREYMAKTEGVPGCIEDFSGAKPLLVQVVKYKRKDVLI